MLTFVKRDQTMHTCFGAGLCLFTALLIVAGFLFIKEPLPQEREGSAPLPENIPPLPGDIPPLPGDTPLQRPEPAPQKPLNPAPDPGSSVSSRGTRTERPPRPEPRGTLVFVIDDAGNNLHELEPFLRFPGPLTIAVLPALPYSAEAARRIREAGKELILHQPMEAVGGQNPGPGAVYLGMGPEEIQEVLARNLAEIGPVVGMNNHQGSRITMNPAAMETILSLCQERGIYFLDSRTTADTVVPAVANRLGIPITERNVFLDNIQQREAMLQSIQEGLVKADRQGSAVMIGHTWSPELAGILTEVYGDLISRGYVLSTLSRLWSKRNYEGTGD